MTVKLRAIRCTAFVTGMFLPVIAFAQAAAQPDSLVVAPVDSLVPAPVQAQTPQPVPTDSAAAPEPERRASGKPTLRTGALTGLRLDGRLNEPAWAAADSIADLTMVEPDEGGVASGRTVVRVLADANDIVVGVRCYDDNPRGIVSFSKARDSELDSEDNVAIAFDTFLDARSGYIFIVNPSGARFDGLASGESDGINSDWDAVWEAETTRDASGWSAEIRIPIKSLTFAKGSTTWGFNLQRRIQRLQEVDRWSGPSLDYEIYQTARAGRLTNLPAFDLGSGTSVRPAAVGRLIGKPKNPGPGIDTHTEGDLCLDVTQKLGSNMLSSLTVNTDFAETEVDVRQINLTRFPIFFPEKRTFFLEGADIFEFGLGLAPEENLLPFHSRRIGLIGFDVEEQTEVPINVGGKINGRVGNTNIGALAVQTRDLDNLALDEFTKINVPATTMGALRVSQNILEESVIGVIGTIGDQQGRDNSWEAGVDLTFQTSSFRTDKNLAFGLYGLANGRDGLTGDRSAIGARIEYPNDLLDTNFSSIRIGNGFDPSLGFVPRNNIHLWDFGCEVNPRPNWSWMRQMFYELSFKLYNKLDNTTWESYELTGKPFDWLLESGDRFDFSVQPTGDKLTSSFEVSADVDLAPGKYEWVRYSMGAKSADKRRVSAELRFETGTYYSGTLDTYEARLTMRPSPLVTVELTGERSDGKVDALIDDYEQLGLFLTEKTFREQLYGVRLQLNISPTLELSSLTQYDNQSREMGTNNRLRWTFAPLGDLFVVYNHNLIRNPANKWLYVSNELPIKLQYAWRF
jgi:hypothetical protein